MDLLEEYRGKQPLYLRLVEEVKFSIAEWVGAGDVKIAALLGRPKELASLEEKLGRKHYETLDSIPDLAGVRVVCLYEYQLGEVEDQIRTAFKVISYENKIDDLGVDRMGYQGSHFVVEFGFSFSGPRYNHLVGLRCEIQVRTVLQDAWALISHHLVYKNESAMPTRLRRDLNNVTSLLEIAQSVFDSVEEKRELYLSEIEGKSDEPSDFLAQEINYDTLSAYTKRRYPQLGISEVWQSELIRDLDKDKYRTLADLERAVLAAEPAVERYVNDAPGYFETGTDYLTKSVGFVDTNFRRTHSFSHQTLRTFDSYSSHVKPL